MADPLMQLLMQAEARVRDTITAFRPVLNELAQLLLKQETVERESLAQILRGFKRLRTTSATTDIAAMA